MSTQKGPSSTVANARLDKTKKQNSCLLNVPSLKYCSLSHPVCGAGKCVWLLPIAVLFHWMMRPYSRGEKALPLQPFSWQLSADIDLEKKKRKRKEKCERRETEW